MSDSVQPHRRQPTRPPRPWDSKNTGEVCHFLLQCMKVKSESEVAQSCPTPSDPMDCSPPGSSVLGFFRQEYWSGLPFPPPGDLPNPGIEPTSPTSPELAGGLFPTVPPGKPAEAPGWCLEELLGTQIFRLCNSVEAFSHPCKLNKRHLPVGQCGHLSSQASQCLALITMLKAKTIKCDHSSILHS